ncbi:MAG TPA: YraN family protein [Adhaeribacter sp.]|nr:YraN family protein [Adhaeribacter sp.]
MAEHNKLGASGEAAAASYLKTKGFTILACNYRYKKAEVDIIASHGKLLVFAEIKTRSSEKFGFPEDFVSDRKIALLLMAAEEYIYQTNWLHDIRFDILSVSVQPSGQFSIHHIEDAFH